MPPLKISTPAGGGISYLNWLDLPTNVQPVELVADTIFPVQEMRPFQEKWFYFGVTLGAIGTNDAFEFSVTCPIDESWRIDNIIVSHNMLSNLEFFVRILSPGDLAQGNLSRVIHQSVDNGPEICIFPARTLQGNITANDRFGYLAEMIILPSERFTITSSANADAGAITVLCRVRYQLRPVPIEGPIISPIVPQVVTI